MLALKTTRQEGRTAVSEEVSAEERREFLSRQGWSLSMTPQERQAIEDEWPNHKIRMALDMNLA